MRLELNGVCSSMNQITDKSRNVAQKETIIISDLARLLPQSRAFVIIAERFVRHDVVLITNKHCQIIFPLDISQPTTHFIAIIGQECGFVIYSSCSCRGSVRYGQRRLTNADCCSSRHVTHVTPFCLLFGLKEWFKVMCG
jgi:hypothetical protein